MINLEKEKKDYLEKQNLVDVEDEEKMNPSASQIISRQPTMNIVVIGHVTNGKSTLAKALTGHKTIRFNPASFFIHRRITHKNSKIYKCDNEKCLPPECYCSRKSEFYDSFPCPNTNCDGGHMRLIRHVSFIDSHSHEVFLSSILNGLIPIDGVILVIAANEEFPQYQTLEGLAAVELMMKMKNENHQNFLITQNKIDIVSAECIYEQYKKIKKFTNNNSTCCSQNLNQYTPVIPISALLKYNMDAVCQKISSFEYNIMDYLHQYERKKSAKMNIIRSFDGNMAGCRIDDIKGGIIGGMIQNGIFRLGQEIEIRPGLVKVLEETNNDGDGPFQNHIVCHPLRTKIISIHCEKNELTYAVRGGLIQIGTELDPSLSRGDRLIGHTVFGVDNHDHDNACNDDEEEGTEKSSSNKLPGIFTEIEVSYFLFNGLSGSQGILKENLRRKMKVKYRRFRKIHQETEVLKLQSIEFLMIQAGSMNVGARVGELKDDLAKFHLSRPICSNVGERVSISRRIDKHWRIIGWGIIRHGKKVEIRYS